MRFPSLRPAPIALAAAAFLSAWTSESSWGQVTGSSDRPNVLFIAIDDLNDWVGCLGGHPNARTPNIDRLASRSVLFENAHCVAPVCNPSRVALLSGMRPSTTGVYGNDQPPRKGPVTKDAVMLPEHFKNHGYKSLGSGKIYHGSFPDPRSWDEFAPSLDDQNFPGASATVFPMAGIPGLEGLEKWCAPVDAEDGEMSDGKTVAYVIDRLKRDHDKPFFLACGIKKPHLTWQVPQKYFDLHPLEGIELPKVLEDDLEDVPECGVAPQNVKIHRQITGAGKWAEFVQAYLAASSFADALVGEVIDALEKSAYKDNTIVVLWTDHGWHLGEKSHWKKFTLWEESTRVVLTIRVPGMTPERARCPRTVSLLDLYPTLLELCGLPAKSENEGISLVPLLKNPAADRQEPAVTTYKRGNHSVRTEDWRYTRYADGSEELYDHRKDEMEWTNLASDPSYAEIKGRLVKWLPKTDAPGSPTK